MDGTQHPGPRGPDAGASDASLRARHAARLRYGDREGALRAMTELRTRQAVRGCQALAGLPVTDDQRRRLRQSLEDAISPGGAR